MSPTAMPIHEGTQASGKIETRLFINNEFVESIGGKTFDVFNPYSEEKVATVYEALPEDVDRAVDAAEAALPAWEEMGATARSAYYYKLADLLEAAGPELAQLEAKETGKIASQYRELQRCTWKSLEAELTMSIRGAQFWSKRIETIRWPCIGSQRSHFFGSSRSCQHGYSSAIWCLWCNCALECTHHGGHLQDGPSIDLGKHARAQVI